MLPQVPPPGNVTAFPPGAARRAVLLSLLALGQPLAAQVREPAPDAFRDPAARELMERAWAARERDVEGLRSYEGVLRERMYVGLTALRFRRERGLFEQERIARIRWSADGEKAIHWLGARQAIPIVGADTRRDEVAAQGRVGKAGADVRDDLRRELPDELLRDRDLPAFALDPADDRLAFGGDWALHPLSDSADAHYRFASGDTLRIHLPPDRDVVLYEVRVEPRRADFHLVAGSLWFDSETGSLVRASYRPARAFNLLLDEPEDAQDVPAILQPVEAEISYITVEYSLHEFRYWLPRRFAMEGEARMGRLLRIPLTVEWSIGDYDVNQASSRIPVSGPLLPGWSRSEQRVEDERGRVSYYTVVVPEPAQLLTSPELSPEALQRTPTAFSDDEVDALRGELEALLPTYRRFRPQAAWGLTQGLTRYNRVEGLSVGAKLDVPFSPTFGVGVEGRIGTGDREPNAALSVTKGPDDGRWTLSGYHRLVANDDWSDPFSLGSSLSNLLFGSSVGEFHRATGASLGYARRGRATRLTLAGFYERHRAVERTTDFSVPDLFGSHPAREVFPAAPATLQGARASLRWFRGQDPNELILTGQLLGEVATGDASYRRGAVTLGASHPLFLGLAAAVEAGAGTLLGDELPQRAFLLGGSTTVRGFDDSAIRGSSFWRGRAELATGFAGARVGLFGDAGWAGPRSAFTFDDPLVSAGVGTSLLDGLIRLDLARGVRGGDQWHVHFYLDGLF
ncbi:MAG TPA: ShlB/FhaC/HecB family hemolysin secretion/activation protein [Longimicrobiales bacterium]|nr:ShlB/FhaC/HecB family hemolysin secretion/activation protein [Longimicrobiales bacterium]